MEFLKKNALGILICLVLAIPAWLLGQRFEVVGGPVFAILIGMVIALDASQAEKAIAILAEQGEKAAVIGRVTDTEGVVIR